MGRPGVLAALCRGASLSEPAGLSGGGALPSQACQPVRAMLPMPPPQPAGAGTKTAGGPTPRSSGGLGAQHFLCRQAALLFWGQCLGIWTGGPAWASGLGGLQAQGGRTLAARPAPPALTRPPPYCSCCPGGSLPGPALGPCEAVGQEEGEDWCGCTQSLALGKRGGRGGDTEQGEPSTLTARD